MLTSFVRFTDDAAGLEKTLRLCQYVAQTAAAMLVASSPLTAKPWAQAHEQFALARRYFRLFKWHESFGMANKEFYRDRAPLRRALEVSKWSFLGLYFFFEMFTFTNAIGVTNYSWAPAMQHEANKYWLYAIVSSIFVSIYRLVTQRSQLSEPKAKDDEKASIQDADSISTTKIYRQLAIDCADVVIPSVQTGWVPLDEVYVGLAGTISTLIAGQELWEGVQSRFASAQP